MKAVVKFWNVVANEKRYVTCDIDIDTDCIYVADNFMNCINPGTELIFDGRTVYIAESDEPIAIILRIGVLEADDISTVWTHTENNKTLF